MFRHAAAGTGEEEPWREVAVEERGGVFGDAEVVAAEDEDGVGGLRGDSEAVIVPEDFRGADDFRGRDFQGFHRRRRRMMRNPMAPRRAEAGSGMGVQAR